MVRNLNINYISRKTHRRTVRFNGDINKQKNKGSNRLLTFVNIVRGKSTYLLYIKPVYKTCRYKTCRLCKDWKTNRAYFTQDCGTIFFLYMFSRHPLNLKQKHVPCFFLDARVLIQMNSPTPFPHTEFTSPVSLCVILPYPSSEPCFPGNVYCTYSGFGCAWWETINQRSSIFS